MAYNLEQRALIDLELTRRSIDFMRRQVEAKRLFFLYVPYTQTHYCRRRAGLHVGEQDRRAAGDVHHQVVA